MDHQRLLQLCVKREKREKRRREKREEGGKRRERGKREGGKGERCIHSHMNICASEKTSLDLSKCLSRVSNSCKKLVSQIHNQLVI